MEIVDWQGLRRPFRRVPWKPLSVLILLEILFVLVLLRSPGTTDASNFFMVWTNRALKDGLIDSYRMITDDYPPFSWVILFVAGKLGALCSIDVFLSFKLSLAAALLCTTLCFWGWTFDAALTALLAFSLYLNGVALGYIDTYWAPTFILSLWSLQKKRIALFSALFAISSFIKWQPLIIAPFLVLHAVSIPPGDLRSARVLAKRWFRLVAPALGVVLASVIVFGYRPIAASLDHALNQELLSGNALNFNWLVTWFLEVFYPEKYGAITDGIVKAIIIDPSVGWATAIKLIFGFFYLGALWRLFRLRASFAAAIECSLVGYLSYFIFNIGVHENHLFLATILAVATVAFAREKFLRAVLIVGVSNLNLIAFYGLTGSPLAFTPVVAIDVSIIFSAMNVVLFLILWSDLVLCGKNVPTEPSLQAAGQEVGE
jgi:hypothetical protein